MILDGLYMIASKIGVFKMLAALGLKSILLFKIVKFSAIIAVVFTTATWLGFPVHDIWFDYVLFIVASSIVAGEPEPDSVMTRSKFFYTWFYRSTHLMVASATAYFIHQKDWSAISGNMEPKG